MGAYEIVVVLAMAALAVVFFAQSVKRYGWAGQVQDQEERRAARKKALLWAVPGVMSACTGLYVVFRAWWLFMPVVCAGIAAMAFSMGDSFGGFMKKNL